MPTVRLRGAREYPEAAQQMFEVTKAWFAHDFREPPAMSRVMIRMNRVTEGDQDVHVRKRDHSSSRSSLISPRVGGRSPGSRVMSRIPFRSLG